MAHHGDSKASRLVRILEGTVLVIATLYFGRPILVPIVAAVLLTFLLSPAVKFLERRHLPHTGSVLAVVAFVFAFLGAITWITTTQLSELVLNLPRYQDNVHAKIQDLRGSESGTLRQLGDSIGQISSEIKETLDEPVQANKQPSEPSKQPQTPTPVTIVADPNSPLETAYLTASALIEPLASAGVLTVLVIFMLFAREDLRDRLVRLAGINHVTLTTRTFDELGTRISRYLLLNAMVNGAFGLIIGLGLFAIGVEYAALWGVLGAILRFIPYVGALIAAAAPVAVAVAQFPGWSQPLSVIGLFVVVGLLADNVIEPLVYGRGAGISPVALLLAAMFWSWLWGPVGLVLSVPLTVSLAVLGKYLPPLEPLWILLGNEESLIPSVRYYQRLLADDVDEAIEVLDEYRKGHSLTSTFDDVLLPALAQSERDREHGDIDAESQTRIWSTTEQLVEELSLEDSEIPSASVIPSVTVVGIQAADRADAIALKMLARIAPANIHLELAATEMLIGELLDQLERDEPDLVCISALGPGGVGPVRYACKRIRQRFPNLNILVARWAFQGKEDRMIQNLKERGASHVTTNLASTLALLAKIPTNTHRQTSHPALVTEAH